MSALGVGPRQHPRVVGFSGRMRRYGHDSPDGRRARVFVRLPPPADVDSIVIINQAAVVGRGNVRVVLSRIENRAGFSPSSERASTSRQDSL